MKAYQSLSHAKWDCKYHVVFLPKRRKKLIFGSIRKHLGEILHELAKQREYRIVEGHLMQAHVHMCISIPPKYSVSNVIGDIKGKSAILIARGLWEGHGILRGRTFGYAVTSFRRWVWMRRRCARTYVIKSRKMSVMNR